MTKTNILKSHPGGNDALDFTDTWSCVSRVARLSGLYLSPGFCYLEESSGLWAALSTPLVDIFCSLSLAPSLQTDRRHCSAFTAFNEPHLRGAGPALPPPHLGCIRSGEKSKGGGLSFQHVWHPARNFIKHPLSAGGTFMSVDWQQRGLL